MSGVITRCLLSRQGPRLVQLRGLKHVIGAPPKNKVSYAEKMILGSIMIVAIWALPTYIMVNIKNYKEKQEA